MSHAETMATSTFRLVTFHFPSILLYSRSFLCYRGHFGELPRGFTIHTIQRVLIVAGKSNV